MAARARDDAERHSIDFLPAGTKVGDYRVVESLGGEIVEFYTATGAYPDKIAVLAILSERISDDRLYRAEFSEEAETTAAMNHPCIKSVSRVREYRKRPYYVIEFVDNDAADEYIKDIRQRIADETEPPAKPVDWWNRYVVVGAVIILLIITLLWLIGKLGVTG